MQSDLFSCAEENLAIDLPLENAQVTYYPQLIASEQADRVFTELRDTLAWRQDHIKMYGKEVKIPRLQAWYGDKEAVYTYSGLTMTPNSWTQSLLTIRTLCEQKAGVKFNAVLANYYRDGQDSMGWHADDEPELGCNPVIASVSLGQPRRFDFRHKTRGDKHQFELEHGSLLLMAGETQKFWQHGIAKRASALAGRINLTFRMIYPLEK